MKIWYDPKGSTGNHPSLNEARETQSRKCKECNEEKTWVFVKRIGLKKMFADASGRYWNSAACPDCGILRTRRSQAKAKKRKAIGFERGNR